MGKKQEHQPFDAELQKLEFQNPSVKQAAEQFRRMQRVAAGDESVARIEMEYCTSQVFGRGGACDRALDIHGKCPNAGEHVD